MSMYAAPLRDMHFVMRELAGLDRVSGLPGCEHAATDLVAQILDQAAAFARDVLAPLNHAGDREGARFDQTGVAVPAGFKNAYRQFVECGWNGLGCEPRYGGQGLPLLVAMAVNEMWNAANLSFSLCPLLTMGAIQLLSVYGTRVQKDTYLPNMVSGKWTGTMNMTEPQAGSDLAAVRTRATPRSDGSYRIHGQKIFITYGEHDLAENIVHLVLARTPDAPEGVRGLSLFVVPKFLVSADGSLGTRNDVRCIAIERKLGIHASPTCVMAYGEQGGATGFLVGQENHGLQYMFMLVNASRLAVGIEGIALSERAYQKALSYARERVQGYDVAARGGAPVTIIHHPDVRRMLMLMKSQIEAMRALAYVVAAAQDIAWRHPDQTQRAQSQALVDLLTPVIKGWGAETSVELTSLGLQIHGGAGYVEDTGAAQYLRDARITHIYEGTTGIQANDLIGRKVVREGGATVKALIEAVREVERRLADQPGIEFASMRAALATGAQALDRAVDHIVANYERAIRTVAVGAVPFLKLTGLVAGGWQMARAALIARQRVGEPNQDNAFYRTKIATAQFYAEHVLPQALALAHEVMHGGGAAYRLAAEEF